MRVLFGLFWLFLGLVAHSGGFGPEFGMLGKSLLGANSLAALDVSTPLEVSWNPAILPLTTIIFNEQFYSEYDYGSLNFADGPTVTNTWQISLARPWKSGALRVARYDIDSSSAPIKYFGKNGPNVKFSGQGYEISVGQYIAPGVALGVGYVPYEKIRTVLSTPEIGTFIRAEGKSTADLRLGVHYLVSSDACMGLVYADSQMESTARFFTSNLVADYRQKTFTLGATCCIGEGTALSGVLRNGTLKGENLYSKINVSALALKRRLTPDLTATVSYSDNSWGYELDFTRNGWVSGVSYTPAAFRSSSEIMGTANALYIWAGRPW